MVEVVPRPIAPTIIHASVHCTHNDWHFDQYSLVTLDNVPEGFCCKIAIILQRAAKFGSRLYSFF
jgi:hypothetical protein